MVQVGQCHPDFLVAESFTQNFLDGGQARSFGFVAGLLDGGRKSSSRIWFTARRKSTESFNGMR
jgi:hypothetical protein